MHTAARTKELNLVKLGFPEEISLKIVDSIRSQGPKLIELATSDASKLRAARPDLSFVRKSEFRLAMAEQAHVVNGPKLAALVVSLSLKITVTAQDTEGTDCRRESGGIDGLRGPTRGGAIHR